MIRLDKYLCDCNIGSRSQVKNYIKKGLVRIGEDIVKDPDIKLNEDSDKVFYCNEPVCYKKYLYIMLNKPEGVVSATRDGLSRTVIDLLSPLSVKGCFPIGRLDKDTTGLLIISNDGMMAHRTLSPKHHVDKTYLVEPLSPLSESDIKLLESGVDIGDETPTLPAKITLNSDDSFFLTIHEGRYHQIKRMLESIGNKVTKLKRISFGPIILDENLKEGCFRELTEDEINKISII